MFIVVLWNQGSGEQRCHRLHYPEGFSCLCLCLCLRCSGLLPVRSLSLVDSLCYCSREDAVGIWSRLVMCCSTGVTLCLWCCFRKHHCPVFPPGHMCVTTLLSTAREWTSSPTGWRDGKRGCLHVNNRTFICNMGVLLRRQYKNPSYRDVKW